MSLQRHWLHRLLLPLLLLVTANTMAEDAPYAAGIDYGVVTPPLPRAAAEGVQVLELFWYGCPHCFQLEPHLERWLATKPAAAQFERMPAIFSNPTWRLHAQAFYTAEVLGVSEKLHGAMMTAIHLRKRPLNSAAQLRQFFIEQGVEGERFDRTFNSFAVQMKVNRAADITRRAGIDGVPAVIVAGKYRATGGMAGSYANMFAIIDHLVAKEAAE